MQMGRFGLVLLVAAVAILALALLRAYLESGRESSSYAYSDLLADAAAGRVEAIEQDGTRLTVTLSGASDPRLVQIASESINVYAEVCAAAGAALGECPIDYAARAPSAAGSMLSLLITALLPVILIGTFIFFMMRQAQKDRA